jgi:hypothetical protein
MQLAGSNMTAKIEFRETIQEIYTVHKFEKKKKYTTLKTYIHSSKTLKINTIDSFMEWNHYLQGEDGRQKLQKGLP